MTRARRARLGLAAALCGVILVSGCGDDDDDDATTSQSAASGSPLALGFINTENSPAGDYADTRRGSEAAVEYINQELGGIGGRPIELETCVTNASPESSIKCANTFVQKNKLAVLSGVELGAATGMPIYTAAGKPVFPAIALSAEEFTSPTSFAFVGGNPAAVAGMASYAATGFEAKKVSVLTLDAPPARAAFEKFFMPVMAKYGIEDVNLVYESGTAADLTPAMTLANQSNPDVIVIAFGASSCGAAMRAANSLSIDPKKLVYAQECASKTEIETGGGGGDGAAYQSPYLSPDSDEPNLALYREKMAEYAPDASISVGTLGGFNLAMNFYEVMKNSGSAEITSDSIVQAFRATVDSPGFASHTFTCDGQQFPGFSSICDTNIRILRYENGTFTDAVGDWINGVKDLAP